MKKFYLECGPPYDDDSFRFVIELENGGQLRVKFNDVVRGTYNNQPRLVFNHDGRETLTFTRDGDRWGVRAGDPSDTTLSLQSMTVTNEDFLHLLNNAGVLENAEEEEADQ